MSMCLSIVATFRKYHSFLLVSEDLTVQAFEGLVSTMCCLLAYVHVSVYCRYI